MRSGLAGLGASLLEELFPPACVICGGTLRPFASPLCPRCTGRMPAMAPPRCRRCGATAAGAGPGPGCGECRDWDEAAPRCRAPYRMEGPAARAVRALKYGGWTRLSEAMARAMEPPARRLAGDGRVVLVPVPLAPARLRERGFNQAELLARGLSRLTGWEVRLLLRRGGGSRSQAGSGRIARRSNVTGAFRAGGEAPDGSRVLLVDDVITTGATTRACGAALEAGGERIAGAVAFARTLPPIHGA